MTDQMRSDPRFQGRFAWEVTPEENDTIRSTWLTHVQAEEKLFVPHTPQDEQEQLAIVFGTMADDCVYELKQAGERWEGQAAARRFYQTFLAAFSGMQWAPQTVVIGPQGILDVADLRATQEAPFAGIDRVGQPVRLEWVIYFPWNPGQKKFEGVLDPAAVVGGWDGRVGALGVAPGYHAADRCRRLFPRGGEASCSNRNQSRPASSSSRN